MKTDDDMYINIKQLYELVARNTVPHFLTGALICGAKPIRDPHNKWHSPRYMFEKHVYPDYVSGKVKSDAKPRGIMSFWDLLQLKNKLVRFRHWVCHVVLHGLDSI